jgi:hypothetical protein
MNSNYILSLFEKENFFENKDYLEQIKNYLHEFHYATKYLSQTLKIRSFVIYLLFFKKAYFEIGQRNITIKLSDIGQNILSDQGNNLSEDSVRRGVDELVQKGYIKKYSGKTGEINQYEIKLPSEIREVKELIDKDNNFETEIINDDLIDYYTSPEKRIIILERDNYKCCYCLKEISRDNFYLDHIYPRSKGGFNYRSNLLSSCKSCNTKKNDKSAEDFLLSNYRNGLLLQEEYLQQRVKLNEFIKIYEEIKNLI